GLRTGTVPCTITPASRCSDEGPCSQDTDARGRCQALRGRRKTPGVLVWPGTSHGRITLPGTPTLPDHHSVGVGSCEIGAVRLVLFLTADSRNLLSAPTRPLVDGAIRQLVVAEIRTAVW